LVVQSGGKRDFTDARDVARGILRAVEDAQARPGGTRVYNIATGVGTSFRELADAVVRLTGSTSPIEEAMKEASGTDLVADVARARDELGYQTCISLREGLEHYLQWLSRQSSS
jgi:UDP-glucose 4-epimerase